MKKSILLGCIAACALSAGTASADVIKPTSDEVKNALTHFLGTTTQVGTVFNLDDVKVVANGDDFDLTFPAARYEGTQLSPKTIHLTYAGDFNNYAQYKVESPFENVQTLFKEILPDATFNAESAEVTTIWVPKYNLVTKNSQNIKGLKVAVPNMFDLTVGSLVSDALIRVVGTDKMDAAGSNDGRDIQISANNTEIIIPSFSANSALIGADITADPIQQMFSSTSDTFEYSIPEVQLKMQGASAPMASLSVSGKGSYQNEVLHFENKIDNINSATLGAFVPAALLPDVVSVDFSFEGLSKEVASQLFAKAQSGAYSDSDVPVLKQAVKESVFKVNHLEAKNNLAGIAVSGTIRVELKDADSVTTLNEMERNLSPVIDAKVVITNLDKISPEPHVNQAQCDRATEYLNAIDMTDPNAQSQKDMAEMQRRMACAPQGGPLDMIRPYLDMNNRVVGVDGTTTDTMVITFENDSLTVNGQQIR